MVEEALRYLFAHDMNNLRTAVQDGVHREEHVCKARASELNTLPTVSK